MILSYRAWKNRFQGDPEMIGRVVRANGEMTTIVGVMPERFGFPGQMDAWLAIRTDPLAFRAAADPPSKDDIQAVARLKKGVNARRRLAECRRSRPPRARLPRIE